jgi:hypothetical protein
MRVLHVYIIQHHRFQVSSVSRLAPKNAMVFKEKQNAPRRLHTEPM